MLRVNPKKKTLKEQDICLVQEEVGENQSTESNCIVSKLVEWAVGELEAVWVGLRQLKVQDWSPNLLSGCAWWQGF